MHRIKYFAIHQKLKIAKRNISLKLDRHRCFSIRYIFQPQDKMHSIQKVDVTSKAQNHYLYNLYTTHGMAYY